MAPSPILYLVSTAGHPNYGDELIAATWLRYLAQRVPNADVWLDCPQPGRAAALLAGIHPRLHVTDTLWRVSQQANQEDRGMAHECARRLVTDRGTPREDIGLDLAARAEKLHLIGGGHLTSRWPANLLLPTIASQLVRLHEMPAFMTGAGLLPIDDADAEHVTLALRDFAHVDVRDAASAAKFGVTLGADDVLLGLRTGTVRRDDRPTPTAMLLLQGDVHDREALAAALPQALDVFRDRGLGGTQLGVVECVPPDDSWLLDEIQEQWGDVRFYPFAEVWQQGLPARAGQFWVTTRFHAHLVAAATGASGIAINTGVDYYKIKHASLVEMGTGWATGEVGSVWDSPAVAADFSQTARRLGEEKLAVADSLYTPDRGRPGLFRRRA